MPQVPYVPYSTERPSDQGTPHANVATPGAAFGENIGKALEGLGKTVEGAGSELFSRAVAMQELSNRAEADNLVTNYTIEAGKRHANFSAARGKNAVDGLEPYYKDLSTTREDIRGSSTNPAVQRLYDSETRGTMARTMFNGAGHAATENKKYLDDAATASISASLDTVYANPTDEATYQAAVKDVKAKIGTQSGIRGWSEAEEMMMGGKAVSSLTASRIIGLSRTSPESASEMLEKNRDNLRGPDIQKAEQAVHGQLRQTGARNISDAVNKGFGPYMTQADISRTQGVEPALINVMKQAQRDHPELEFKVGSQGGRRSQAEQDALFAQGRTRPGPVVTWTRDSDHIRGIAADIVPTKGTPEQVRTAMEEASQKLGIPLQASLGAKDPNHYALPRDYDLAGAPKPQEESLASRTSRAENYARQKYPDLTDVGDTARDRTMSDFTRQKAIQRDADYTNINTINTALVGGFGDGKLPTTVEELTSSDPKVEQAWNALDDTKRRGLMKNLTANAKVDNAWTTEGLKQYQTLKGLAHSSPEEFLGKDVIAEKLPNSAKKELINLQQRMISKAEGDPRVTHAMQVLQPMLGPAALSKDDKNQFIGALQDALTDFQTQNKKLPQAKDINEIGTRLLQEQHDSSKFLSSMFNRTSPMYQVEVPEKDKEAIKNDPYWAGKGITPDDTMIQRIYTAQLYQKLYSKGKSQAK